MTQAIQHAKFRWTENLTCRFIQLRKEYRKLFTGRKYSAQAGWECILQYMRAEFPTIMGNVHYRVLKKKWSNLLQQYKELKNPVHGDRNKADDVSWPFYSSIDEVLGHERGTTPINDEYIDPHEFLCVSVTPEEPTSSVDTLPVPADPEIERRIERSLPEGNLRTFGADCEIETGRSGSIECVRQTNRRKPVKRKRKSRIPRLPDPTEVTIEKVTAAAADCSKDLSKQDGKCLDLTGDKGWTTTVNERNEDEGRPRKSRRGRVAPYRENRESRTDHRIEQIFEYMKRRDEENRSIMVRVMHAVECIANRL